MTTKLNVFIYKYVIKWTKLSLKKCNIQAIEEDINNNFSELILHETFFKRDSWIGIVIQKQNLLDCPYTIILRKLIKKVYANKRVKKSEQTFTIKKSVITLKNWI